MTKKHSSRCRLFLSLWSILVVLIVVILPCHAFVIHSPTKRTTTTRQGHYWTQRTTTTLSSLSSSRSPHHHYNPKDDTTTTTTTSVVPQTSSLFEYQELRIQLRAMMEQNISFRQLDVLTRQQWIQYAMAVVDHHVKTTKDDVPPNESGQTAARWRLVLSNQTIMQTALPADATIYLSFLPKESTQQQKLQYQLQLGPHLSLQATGSYEWTFHPDNNVWWLTFWYQDITTNLWKWTNLSLTWLTSAWLVGRVNYIPTVFWDDHIWIERGRQEGEGEDYYVNVYIKEPTAEETDKGT